MKRNYCLPIIKTTQSEVDEIISANDELYSYFEIWLDYLNGLDETYVGELSDRLGGRAIFLFRRQNLDPIQLSLEKRLAIIKWLSGKPSMIDLDISQTEELEYVRDNTQGTNLVLSYHNYDSTPDSVRLKEIIGTMEEYKPAVYKLASQCGSETDALRLLQLLRQLKADDKRAVVLGMGENGLITRVFGTLWGNEFTFAPIKQSESSAPGQLTRQQLETIFKELGQ